MKTIFITGASSGLGKATALLFASRGWQVIATMRQPEKETELAATANITLLQLDVTSTYQIEQTVSEVTRQYEIDVVLNNAGYGLIGPLESLQDEQLERQFDTNVLGVIRVTRAFIPYFRNRQQGLFLTTTSIAGLIGLPLTAVYCATKWALEGWTEALSYELSEVGIGIKTIAPGGIQTDFTGRSLDTTTHPAYAAISEKLYHSFDPAQFTPAEQIAQVVFEAATDGKAQLRYLAGADAKATYAHRLEVGNEDFQKELAKHYVG